MQSTYYDQHEYEVRCEWGPRAAEVLAPISDVVIVVDVLSFSTSVDIAVSRGAIIYPYQRSDESAAAFAASLDAELADPARKGRYSLSPASLVDIPAGTRLVLPSLNGARLALAAGETPLLSGCLRNARAVALAAATYGKRIAVIPAGERWMDDHSLRPALEDLIGAGAIISHLPGSRSPEATAAVAAFKAACPDLAGCLRQCSSGKELIGRGFEQDVVLAAQLDISDTAPVLIDGAFRPWLR